MSEIPYTGTELELFQHAKNWKNYFGGYLKPYLKGHVLEVGAGIGGTTPHVCDGSQKKWVCLEPDSKLYFELEKRIEGKQLPSCCTSIFGTTENISPLEKFDSILYIDVIEHIQDDKSELKRAKDRLSKDGLLIVLVPANQSLFSPFDEAIGHYRRYDKKMLSNAVPVGLEIVKLFYLDSLGLFASVINKYLLKQKYPTLQQVIFWDRFIVQTSRFIDPAINYSAGKSLIGIWRNKDL